MDSFLFGAGVTLLLAAGAMLAIGLSWLANIALYVTGWPRWGARIVLVLILVVAFAALHYYVIAR